MKVGVVVMLGELSELGRAPRYAEIRQMAQTVEDLGFDSVWLFDHLLFRWGEEKTAGIWECWTMLASLAEATQRVELGTLVLCTQFRNPALLAKMAVTLDEISNGRLILGLGAGWHKPEFDAFGFPYDHRVSRFEEALQIIRPLLHAGHVDFQGRFYSAHDCQITPRGPRGDGPPLLVGAFGPRMLRLTARYADMWNHAWLGLPDGLDEPLSSLHDACAEEDRDPSTLAITVAASVVYPQFGDVRANAGQPLSGSVEEIAAALRGYSKRGVSHLIFQVSPYTVAALELLAQAVKCYRKQL